MRHRIYRRILAVAACAVALIGGRDAEACPFCGGVSLTLSEEIKANDLAVIGHPLDAKPGSPAATQTDGPPAAREIAPTPFAVERVLKGEQHLAGKKQVSVVYYGKQPEGTQFLLLKTGEDDSGWRTPIALSKRSAEYVAKLASLPESGADRLAFFQDYFEDEEPLMAADAYDEFARSPYKDVQALKDRMPREKLLKWIQQQDVAASRRRLYLTMLGVCGKPDDVSILEGMVRSDDPATRTALDALIACYLSLTGADGLPLIEERFLNNPDAEYTDTYFAIQALRFHGQEVSVIPRKRLAESLRPLLERPQAELVIVDLARWQDWSVMDRLVRLFKEADADVASFVRVPIVNYLKACPLPEAKQHLAELEKIDPESVKRASIFSALTAAPPVPPPTPSSSSASDASIAEAVKTLTTNSAPLAESATALADAANKSAPATTADGSAAAPRDASPASSDSTGKPGATQASHSQNVTEGGSPSPWIYLAGGTFVGLLVAFALLAFRGRPAV